MRKIAKNGIEVLSSEEEHRILELVDTEHSDDFHYLAFDRQLTGFSPLCSYLSKYQDILDKENEIIAALENKQEVESLYPKAKVSLYPVTKIEGPKYYLEMANYETAIILESILKRHQYYSKYSTKGWIVIIYILVE